MHRLRVELKVLSHHDGVNDMLLLGKACCSSFGSLLVREFVIILFGVLGGCLIYTRAAEGAGDDAHDKN